jgi:hypothetical protein
MKKIEKLTYEQEKELKTTLEKWLEIGRSTKRIDRIKSANAIKALYKVNGKQEPFIWFCDSPYQCLFIIHLLKSNLGNNLWINLENNLWINLENNLWINLENNLRSNLRNNLGSNLRDNLENNLENNLWNNLWSNLGNNLRDKIWNNLRDNHLVDAKINFENYFGGSQWCGWKVFYDFCNKIGVQYSKKDKEILSLWMEEASECYWWFPFEEMKGQTPRLWGGLMSKEDYLNFWNTIKNDKKVYKGTFKNMRKSGQLYEVYAIVSPILDEKENVIGFIGNESDITQEKEKQEQAEKLNKLTTGRELKIIELKKIINELKNKTSND